MITCDLTAYTVNFVGLSFRVIRADHISRVDADDVVTTTLNFKVEVKLSDGTVKPDSDWDNINYAPDTTVSPYVDANNALGVILTYKGATNMVTT